MSAFNTPTLNSSTQELTTSAVTDQPAESANINSGSGVENCKNVNIESQSNALLVDELQIKDEIADSSGSSDSELEDNEKITSIKSTDTILKPQIRVKPTTTLMPNKTTSPLDPKRKFVCPYDNCTKSYGKSSHLRSHLTWHTGIKPFVCQEPSCGKGFTRSDELNRHVRTHTGEKPFECMQCMKKFARSDHLTKHLATHTKQIKTMLNTKRPRSSYANSSSGASVSDEPSNKKIYNKKQNPKHASTLLADGMHFMAELMHNSDEDLEHFVDTNAVNTLTLRQHLPIKLKLERQDNSVEYQVVPSPGFLHTSVKKDLVDPLEMADKGTEIQVEEESSRHTALVDDDIMPEANALVSPNSENNSDDARPFYCTECIKSFKRQDDLNRHMRTHTGEKPYSCGECDRRFMRSDHLKKHLTTHTRIR